MSTQIKKAQLDTNLISGWTPANETWTYASASTFTIAGVDRTAVYTKGTRLKFTQSGSVKYAVVVASSFSTNTTVTIAVNTDFTIANAAISANYYSYQANPQGYPGWFNYASTVVGSTGSAGTYAESLYTSAFNIIGNMCLLEVYKDITNKGSWTGELRISLPTNSVNTQFIMGGIASQNGATNTWNTAMYGPFQLNVSYGVFEKGLGAGIVQVSDITASSRIMINGFYIF